jgi:glucokinase
LGAGRGHRYVLLVGVGTGIGGGLVADGKLYRGAHGFATEIGHIVVEPGGPLCGCGNHGCWEQVASGTAITREGRSAVTRHGHSLLAELAGHDPARLTGRMVTEAARRGDPAARGILSEVGHRLGEGIAGLVNVLDPEVVIVGGGASDAGDLLLEPARMAYRMTVEAYEHRPDVPIVEAELRNDAGAIGAALIALEELT